MKHKAVGKGSTPGKLPNRGGGGAGVVAKIRHNQATPDGKLIREPKCSLKETVYY